MAARTRAVVRGLRDHGAAPVCSSNNLASEEGKKDFANALAARLNGTIVQNDKDRWIGVDEGILIDELDPAKSYFQQVRLQVNLCFLQVNLYFFAVAFV